MKTPFPIAASDPQLACRADGTAGIEAVPASFLVYPALDVCGGGVVRLRQGDYARQTHYRQTPLTVARAYAQGGAGWLHLVDLDAAKAGGYTLLPLLEDITRQTGLRVQTGGGVRQAADIERLLAAGARRVVIGSKAIDEPETVAGWLARFGVDRITVALDVRRSGDGRWLLPTCGWTRTSGAELAPLLQWYARSGLRHLLCTDIACDGMLAGPNLPLYREILALAPGLEVQASGGIRNVEDLAGARAAGCAGAVLGKALLDGHLELGDALAAAAAGSRPC